MNQAALSCSKCGDEMSEGFLVDFSYGATLVGQWVKGKPQKAKPAFGILPLPGIEFPKPGDALPIGTFRCQSCGFLEFYVREEFAAK